MKEKKQTNEIVPVRLRLIAYFLDTFLYLSVAWLISAMYGFIDIINRSLSAALLFLLFIIFDQFVLLKFTGSNISRKLLGYDILRKDGRYITFLQFVIRTVVLYTIETFTSGILAFASCFFHKERATLHDILSGSHAKRKKRMNIFTIMPVLFIFIFGTLSGINLFVVTMYSRMVFPFKVSEYKDWSKIEHHEIWRSSDSDTVIHVGPFSAIGPGNLLEWPVSILAQQQDNTLLQYGNDTLRAWTEQFYERYPYVNISDEKLKEVIWGILKPIAYPSHRLAALQDNYLLSGEIALLRPILSLNYIFANALGRPSFKCKPNLRIATASADFYYIQKLIEKNDTCSFARFDVTSFNERYVLKIEGPNNQSLEKLYEFLFKNMLFVKNGKET